MNPVPLSIEPLDVGDPDWAELTRVGEGRTAFHSPELVALSAKAFDHQVIGWKAVQRGELVGGLVVAESGKGRVDPSAFTVCNGPIVRPPSCGRQSSRDRHSSRVISSLLQQVGNEGGALLRLHPATGDIRQALASGWIARPSFTYEMDLRHMDTAWSSMDGDRRRLVRRAETMGYWVESIAPSDHDRRELIDRLVELNVAQKSKYDNVHHPDLRVWKLMVEGLLRSGTGRLFVARAMDGSLVAFQFATVWNDRAANLLTGSSPLHADHGVNSLLRWQAASMMNAEGVQCIDLNGARDGAAGRFKASLGATLTTRWEMYRPDRRPSALARRALSRARQELAGLRASRSRLRAAS